ncbi:uncharacterized protein EV154DRAFT_517810, partial [Mucor mucedo]|uniref:uncharacterized protein n=1 Tax=Mucor mucedo TaxID=29922 RepID=UPI002221256A
MHLYYLIFFFFFFFTWLLSFVWITANRFTRSENLFVILFLVVLFFVYLFFVYGL